MIFTAGCDAGVWSVVTGTRGIALKGVGLNPVISNKEFYREWSILTFDNRVSYTVVQRSQHYPQNGSKRNNPLACV